ncbi:MAG: hypothetical protein AB7L09_01405 [Nitrospira sp.]
MKEFDKPLVTISQDEYEQLQECKNLIRTLWMRFGAHRWPKEFYPPKGLSWADIAKNPEEFDFYRWTHRIDVLMNYDDSE